MSCSHIKMQSMELNYLEKLLASIFKEYKKLNEGPMPEKPIFGPINPSDLTYEDRNMALEE